MKHQSAKYAALVEGVLPPITTLRMLGEWAWNAQPERYDRNRLVYRRADLRGAPRELSQLGIVPRALAGEPPPEWTRYAMRGLQGWSSRSSAFDISTFANWRTDNTAGGIAELEIDMRDRSAALADKAIAAATRPESL